MTLYEPINPREKGNAYSLPASDYEMMQALRYQMIVQLKNRLTKTDSVADSRLGLNIFRADEPTEKTPGVYDPIVCILLQGEKQISVGTDVMNYQEMQFLLVPVTLPASGRVISATSESPYLGMGFAIDLKVLSELVIEMGAALPPVSCQSAGVAISDIDYPLMSAFGRLLRLLDHPEDVDVILPLLKREILYRLLISDIGAQLRNFTSLDTQAHRIAKVIDQLRQKYNETLRVKDLAEMVHMSESALYQGFKSMTAMTPLQFQKQLRLNEARRIMLFDGAEVSTASYRVGYESPSQFSREYSRLFGASPKADISRFKKSGQIESRPDV